jgi:hypothetical protein
VKFDASCSGMQHLCGMTRSENGKLVNLTPPGHNSGPGDLYRDVTARAAEIFTDRWYVELGGKTKKKTKNGKSKDKDNVRLKTFLTKAEADCFAVTVNQFKTYQQAAADKFVGPVDVLKTGHIDVEIDRALAKKPVLSYFYGATRHGFAHGKGPLIPNQRNPTVQHPLFRRVEKSILQLSADVLLAIDGT